MKRIVVIMLMLLFGSATFGTAFSKDNCAVSYQLQRGHVMKSPYCCSHPYATQKDCCGNELNLNVTDKQKLTESPFSFNKNEFLHTLFLSFSVPGQSLQDDHQWQPKAVQLPVSSLYILYRVFRL